MGFYHLKNDRMISMRIQGRPFNIIVIQVYAPTTNAEETETDQLYEDVQHLLEVTPNKYVLLVLGDWNAKVGSQEIKGITGKFGLGVQNEAGQRLKSFVKRTSWSSQTLFSNNTRGNSTHGNHQMGNTEIRLIIFSAGKDGDALYSQQKQDLELIVALIISFLYSSLNGRK